MVSVLPSSDAVHGYSSSAPNVFHEKFLCILDSVIWWLSVCKTRKGMLWSMSLLSWSCRWQFSLTVKCIPECVALHQVGLNDTVRAKVGAPWSQQNTWTDVHP